MKAYEGNLSLDLTKEDATSRRQGPAWDYVYKRWPGAKLIRNQGVGGWAFYLPGDRVLKITDHGGELANARRVRREKPEGVVRVLSVGKHHYIMPRLLPRSPEQQRNFFTPKAPGIIHWDDHDGNMMRCPKTGKVLWIDLDGLMFTYFEAA